MSGERVRSCRDLLVWQKGIALVQVVYRLTAKFPRAEKFGFVGQTRRAAVSVPSNIAEGQPRQHTKEFRQFLHVALGSRAELDTQLTTALELDYVQEGECSVVNEQVLELRKMIHGLLSKLPSGK